jgi:DNA-binding NtrC family response regulator
VVVDCGAIPDNLLESELFGHERGAFTGAERRRIGALEEASGGTVFLDEIGELATELQPSLLRVLENHSIRRVGTNRHVPIDVRVIAATNRDLRTEVNLGRFRADLYYRLAVAKIVIPPLRDRPDDLPVTVAALLEQLQVPAARAQALMTPQFLARLRHAPWPGNVRELRNYLERCLVFEDEARPLPAEPSLVPPELPPYARARDRALEEFERAYLLDLMQRHGGKVSAAATAAGVGRVHMYRLLRRHNIK